MCEVKWTDQGEDHACVKVDPAHKRAHVCGCGSSLNRSNGGQS